MGSFSHFSVQENWLWRAKAPFTLIRFQTKTELFCSGYGYRPQYNAENDHRKRSHSKTLSRVEWFEKIFLKMLCSSVDGENYAIWKRWRHQNRHHRAPDHSTVSIRKMADRSYHVASLLIGVVVWTGKNDTKTISMGANLFENRAKQPRFRLKTD